MREICGEYTVLELCGKMWKLWFELCGAMGEDVEAMLLLRKAM